MASCGAAPCGESSSRRRQLHRRCSEVKPPFRYRDLNILKTPDARPCSAPCQCSPNPPAWAKHSAAKPTDVKTGVRVKVSKRLSIAAVTCAGHGKRRLSSSAVVSVPVFSGICVRSKVASTEQAANHCVAIRIIMACSLPLPRTAAVAAMDATTKLMMACHLGRQH